MRVGDVLNVVVSRSTGRRVDARITGFSKSCNSSGEMAELEYVDDGLKVVKDYFSVEDLDQCDIVLACK